jgi:hypothetical protein
MTIERRFKSLHKHAPGRREAVARPAPRPVRFLGKVAAPFIVHGHRLSSLYRGGIKAPIPFIVLKILIFLPLHLAPGYEYFGNNEAKWGHA